MIKGLAKKIRKFFILLGNFFLWMCPFLIFLILLFLAVYYFKGNFDAYTELLGILAWPVTLLIALFFFRKVATYMFFSMDEFNFFGAKGNLRNVHEMIEEEVDIRILAEKEEKERKKENDRLVKKLEAQARDANATAEENLDLARDILKMHRDYRKSAEKKIEDLNAEIKNSKDNTSLRAVEAAPATLPEAQGIGSGEQITNLSPEQPST